MANLVVNLGKIVENIGVIRSLCEQSALDLVVVTKCFGPNDIILDRVVKSGVRQVAESHPVNYRAVNGNAVRHSLLCSVSGVKRMAHCDVVYLTERDTLRALSNSPLASRCRVVIPVEAGDCREGVPAEELVPFLEYALSLDGIDIAGFSANFCCFTLSAPDRKAVERFLGDISAACAAIDFRPDIVSVGGSSLWRLLAEDDLPPEINQIRIGEAIFLGRDPARDEVIPSLHQDAFLLEGEILELRRKESPIPETRIAEGEDAAPPPPFEGTRAVLDMGHTTCSSADLTPLAPGIRIVGATQDHTVVRLEGGPYAVGDKIAFSLNYRSLTRANISPYLNRVYIEE